MMMEGVFELVSCLDSAAVDTVRNRSVQNAHSLPLMVGVPAAGVRLIVVIGGSVRRLVVMRLRLQFGIQLVKPLRVARQRLDGHRAVQEHREHGYAPLLFQPLQPVDQLFDPPDRERRDDHPPAAPGRVGNHFRQLRPVVVRVMNAIAVGGLDQQVIRLGHHRRIGQHRTVEAPEVTAEENRASTCRDARVRRTEQMTGVDELDLDIRRNRDRPLVTDRLQLRQGAEGIGLAVERQCRRVLRVAVTVRVRRILLLNTAGIRQDDPAEVLGAGGAEHPAAKALRHQAREVAAMIEVRVCEDHGVDLTHRNRELLPVPLAQLFEALEETRVNEHFHSAGVEQVFGACDGPGRAEERD